MKKIYFNPTLEVIKIQTHQMLAASPNNAYEELGGGTQLSRKIEFDDMDDDF